MLIVIFYQHESSVCILYILLKVVLIKYKKTSVLITDCSKPPTIPYGRYEERPVDRYLYGTVLNYRCVNGYANKTAITGTIECEGGEWSEAINCPSETLKGTQLRLRVVHILNV